MIAESAWAASAHAGAAVARAPRELLAKSSAHLADVPALMAAGAILHGTSAVTFDIPVRVFRGHTYRAVIHVEPGHSYPRASVAPSVPPWLASSVARDTGICNRNLAYNICDPRVTFTPTTELAAIDVAFRPTAAFRQSLWPRTGVTPMEPGVAGPPATMGTVWQTPTGGYVEGIRFFDTASEPATVRLYDPTGSCAPGTPPEVCGLLICMAMGTPMQEASGWYALRFEHPCAVVPNHDYIASVFLSSGRLARMDQYFQNMDPVPDADTHPSARNMYEDGFLVASKGVQASGDAMPTALAPGDDRRAYFVEPIVRDGR